MNRQQTSKIAGSWATSVLFAVAGILATGAAFAQATFSGGSPTIVVEPRHSSAPQLTYGTQDQIVYTVPAYDFQAFLGGPIANSGYNRFSTTPDELDAPLQLPSGALIEAIELQGCDTTTSGDIVFILFEVDPNGSFNLLSSLFSTGVSAANGCTYYFQSLSTPHTVDNLNNVYYVGTRGGTTNATTVGAVLIYYRLQISPPPGTATFNDVPTSDPFFKSVEALAASGITGGCGGGNFCPDAVVTREQMAAFLARALGLHWPF